MPTISPEQKLQIARRIHETFQLRKRWHQGNWGIDDDGDTIEFDSGFGFLVEDHNGDHNRPALRDATPESPRCFCLSAAIRIHTASVISELPAWNPPYDPYYVSHATETMCAIYTAVGDIDTQTHEYDSSCYHPYFYSIIGWNDSNERCYQDIRDLTAAVLRDLENPAPAPAPAPADPDEPADLLF